MPKAKTGSKSIQATPKELEFDNPGTVIICYNPAPYYSAKDLADAEAGGNPVLHHRENTPWYLSVPELNVTVKMMVDNTPLVGWHHKNDLVRMADSMVTQLKSLSPNDLKQYQTEVPEYAEWEPELRVGSRFFARMIPNSA